MHQCKDCDFNDKFESIMKEHAERTGHEVEFDDD